MHPNIVILPKCSRIWCSEVTVPKMETEKLDSKNGNRQACFLKWKQKRRFPKIETDKYFPMGNQSTVYVWKRKQWSIWYHQHFNTFYLSIAFDYKGYFDLNGGYRNDWSDDIRTDGQLSEQRSVLLNGRVINSYEISWQMGIVKNSKFKISHMCIWTRFLMSLHFQNERGHSYKMLFICPNQQ